jgi:hypothetical protein
VIALKRNVQLVYENSKLTPPSLRVIRTLEVQRVHRWRHAQ